MVNLKFNKIYYYNRDDKGGSPVYKYGNGSIAYLKWYLSKPHIKFIDNLIIDTIQLNKLWNNSCAVCNNGLGCCDGTPYCYSQNDFNVFLQHKDKIFEIVSDDYNKCKQIVNSSVAVDDKQYLINEFYDVDTDTYRCAMWTSNGCAIRQYCIKNNIDLFELYNLSCMLFPMDILVIDNFLFFTSYIDNNELWDNIGRWSNFNYEMDCKCFSGNGLEIYKLNKELIEHEFGKNTFDRIKRVMG